GRLGDQLGLADLPQEFCLLFGQSHRLGQHLVLLLLRAHHPSPRALAMPSSKAPAASLIRLLTPQRERSIVRASCSVTYCRSWSPATTSGVPMTRRPRALANW